MHYIRQNQGKNDSMLVFIVVLCYSMVMKSLFTWLLFLGLLPFMIVGIIAFGGMFLSLIGQGSIVGYCGLIFLIGMVGLFLGAIFG